MAMNTNVLRWCIHCQSRCWKLALGSCLKAFIKVTGQMPFRLQSAFNSMDWTYCSNQPINHSLSLQSSAVEQVLDILMDILMDILSREIAEVVSPCPPRGLWSHIAIRVFLLFGTVCARHPPYPVLTSCPISRAFPYPQPGDTGGRRSAPAVCQSLTSADPTNQSWKFLQWPKLHSHSKDYWRKCQRITSAYDCCMIAMWKTTRLYSYK